MFKFSKQIAAQLKSQIINQASSFPKNTSQFQLTPRNINKRNSRLIRRMSSSIMGLVELCKVNSYCPPQIIDILQENHEHSKDDISKLQTFLSNSQIYSDLKESNIDSQLINKILIAFIPFLKLDKFPPDMCLCSYGATPHKVYILLEGNIRIIKPISNDFYYNGFDYFCEIMKIKHATLYENNIKLNTDLLLEKTLTTNYHIFHINKDDINLLKFIVFHEMYMKYIVKAMPHSKENKNNNNNNNNNSNSNNNEHKELNILIDLLKQCYLSQKDFNIKYPHSIAYLPYIKSAITSELNQRLNDKVITKYTFINDTEKKRVQIYSYRSTYLNIEGDFIGETSYPNNNGINILPFPKYSEYAISIDHSFCVSIPFDVFFQNINNEKEKIKTKEIGFLLQTHILRPLHFRKFKRAYFHNFILKHYNKGDLIINDTITLIGKVFVIKEGEIQITIKKSLLSLIKIQKRLIALLKEHDCKWERDVVYNEKEIANRKDCNKVYNYKLVCLGEKDVFGNGLVYYNVDNFYNVVVVSEKAKVYEVSKENFMKMAEEDVDVMKRFKLFGIRKIKNLLDRINNILSYVLYYGSGNQCKEEMKTVVKDVNENEGNNEVCNSNSSNNIIQMRFTKYSLNCNSGINGNAQMKTPKFSFTTNHLNKKALCCNSPIRIGKSTTIKEYLSFTKNYHSSRNDYNNNVNNNNNICHQNINTFTIESTIDDNNNNNNKNNVSCKKYKAFRIKKQNKKKNNKTYMNKYVYFEDKLLKYSKMLVQTSSFINDNSINKKYFESTLSNIGRCLSTDNNNNNNININKYKTKSQSTAHNKINIKKNNLTNIKTSPYLTHTMTATLTSSNDKGSTLELKLPNITEMLSNTRQSFPIHNKNNTINANNNEDDSCTMEINIQPKDCGMKGKKMGFNVNNIKVNKNIIYKKVIKDKLGY